MNNIEKQLYEMLSQRVDDLDARLERTNIMLSVLAVLLAISVTILSGWVLND